MMKYIPIIKTHTTAFNIVLVFSQLPVGGWSLEPCGRGITALLEAWLQRVEKVNAEQKQCHFVPFSGGARWWMKLSWTKLGSAQPSQTLLSAAKPKQLCALVPEGALWSGVEWSGWCGQSRSSVAQTIQFGGFVCHWFSLSQIHGRGMLGAVAFVIFSFVSGGHVVLAPVASSILSLSQWPAELCWSCEHLFVCKSPSLLYTFVVNIVAVHFLCHCCFQVNCSYLNSETLSRSLGRGDWGREVVECSLISIWVETTTNIKLQIHVGGLLISNGSTFNMYFKFWHF